MLQSSGRIACLLFVWRVELILILNVESSDQIEGASLFQI
jgi:hypothetical protein